MVRAARDKLPSANIRFIVGDAEVINYGRGFDLVTSNAALQWFGDPRRAILKFKEALAGGGVLAFTVFGPLTFKELGRSIRSVLNRDMSISSDNFLGKGALARVLREYFISGIVEVIVIKKTYPCLLELLRLIKYTGVRGRVEEKAFTWEKKEIGVVEDFYRAEFGAITASYQVFFCAGKK